MKDWLEDLMEGPTEERRIGRVEYNLMALAKARELAQETGRCPASLIDDEFVLEHWPFWDLCAMFDCGECVVTPEDFGYDPERQRGDSSDCDCDEAIPF